jgi:hypothetical protein
MEIIRKEIDVTGSYRVLVSIDETQSKEFKFDHNPTDIEVLSEGQVFIDNQIQETPKMKNTVTQRQLRLWLYLKKGITNEMILSLISQIPDATEKQKAMIEWEYASVFDREHPLIQIFGIKLGLTSEELDIAFLEANSI